MPHRHLRVARAPHRLDVALGVARRQPSGMLDHRGFHQAGQDRVDPDMLRGELHRRGARHLVHRGLAGAVANIGDAEGGERGDRRDVDDRAAALPGHDRNDMLHRKKGAFEIDREYAVPFGLRYFDHAPHLGDADIVVEHVDAAVGLQAGGHHRLDLGRPGHVGGERGGLAAFARDDIDGLLSGGAVAVDAKHLRALARKGHRGRLAIAPARPDRAGADHHRCLALEPLHRLLPDLLVIARTPASSWHSRRADARISPTAYGNCQRCTAAIRRRRRNWPAPVPAAARALAPIETKSGWHSIYNWRRGDAASYWQDRGSPRNLAAAKPARQRPVLDLGERHNACSSYSWIIL